MFFVYIDKTNDGRVFTWGKPFDDDFNKENETRSTHASQKSSAAFAKSCGKPMTNKLHLHTRFI